MVKKPFFSSSSNSNDSKTELNVPSSKRTRNISRNVPKRKSNTNDSKTELNVSKSRTKKRGSKTYLSKAQQNHLKSISNAKSKAKLKTQRKYSRSQKIRSQRLKYAKGSFFVGNKPVKKQNPRAENEYNGYEGNVEDNDNYEEKDEEEKEKEVLYDSVYSDKPVLEDYLDNVFQFEYPEKSGCSSLSLEERMIRINKEIETVYEDYVILLKTISDEVFASYLEKEEFSDMKDWLDKTTYARVSQFQLTSKEDLKYAYTELLPEYDPNKNVTHPNLPGSLTNIMIEGYVYKMVTSLFTRANITHTVFMYDTTPIPHQYLNNLLGVMRDSSRLINTLFKQNWYTFSKTPLTDEMYVHSGGNLIVAISGMLCYLYERKPGLPPSMMEDIAIKFETVMGEKLDSFYGALRDLMKEDEFRKLLFDCTENISDLDFLFMTKGDMVDDIENVPLQKINDLSAYVLRSILIKAHKVVDDKEPMIELSKNILTFAGKYDKNWTPFRWFNMSGNKATEQMKLLMKGIDSKQLLGYRQTSNKIPEVPMYLNRLKQGYEPFYRLNMKDIDPEKKRVYASKYGECIDLSVGVRTNELYDGKNRNFSHPNEIIETVTGMYYTVDTPYHELEFINKGIKDDKTPKRLRRQHFLKTIQRIPGVDVLFLIIGNYIT